MGLSGFEPDTIEADEVPGILQAIRSSKSVLLDGARRIDLDEKTDVLLYGLKALPFHPNGMKFTAYDKRGNTLVEKIYYSVGGGFVVSEKLALDSAKQKAVAPDTKVLPLPFHSGEELLRITREHACSIADIMRRNESHRRDDESTKAGLLNIWRVMQQCVDRGCRTEGTLLGGFKVKRRAFSLAQRLEKLPVGPADPLAVMDWVNLFALAVNEENALEGGSSLHQRMALPALFQRSFITTPGSWKVPATKVLSTFC